MNLSISSGNKAVGMMKCQQCKRSIKNTEMIRIVRKRRGNLDLCPTCFQEFNMLQVRDLNITKQQEADVGKLIHGYKTSDIKNHLRVWGKNLAKKK